MEGECTLKVNTKFGSIEIQKDEIINFMEKPLGFSSSNNFVIFENEKSDLFLWLQNIDDPNISFPVIEINLIKPDINLKLSKKDREKLKLDDNSNLSVYAIVTIPKDPMEMSANLRAPIFVNNSSKIGAQIVMQDNNLDISYPIFVELRKKMSKGLLNREITANSDVKGVSLKSIRELNKRNQLTDN
jgi:flagellar assembly factor FliW